MFDLSGEGAQVDSGPWCWPNGFADSTPEKVWIADYCNGLREHQSRGPDREMSKERLMHGKEHQVSMSNEILMTTASARAVSMER